MSNAESKTRAPSIKFVLEHLENHEPNTYELAKNFNDKWIIAKAGN